MASITKRFEKLVDKMLSRIRDNKQARRDKSKIKRYFKEISVHRQLTAEQKKAIDDFYMGIIGEKVPYYCHEYFYSRTGVFFGRLYSNRFLFG